MTPPFSPRPRTVPDGNLSGDPDAGPLAAAIRAAADRLWSAGARGRPCAPVRDLLPAGDVAAAYAVQRRLTARRQAGGARVVGRKIGLTAPVVQRQLGVDQPDFGVLFADMDASGRPELPPGRLIQPRVEAEIAFVLAADLDQGDLDDAQIRASVDHAVAALEIVDSRVAGWDITITDTVADNGSAGLFVLGPDRWSLSRFEPRDVVMTMLVDGRPVSEGTGAACLGDPLLALAWLARTAQETGDPLRAGQVVLSGALGPMVPLEPGAVVEAHLSPLGTVRTRLAPKEY